MGAFGEKLRRQRELRGLSLEAISTTTKIGTRMLRAIEDEHFDQLPGGVFNKGFVRAYARQVGLDEDEAVTDYLTALRESQIQSQTLLPNFRNGKSTIEADPRNPERDNHPRGNDLQGRQAVSTLPKDALDENDPPADPPTADRRISNRRKETRRRDDREVHAHEVPSEEVRPGEVASSEPIPNDDHDDEVLSHVASSLPLSFLNLSSEPSSSQLPAQEQIEAAAPVLAEPPPQRIPWEKLAVPFVVMALVLASWTLHRRSQSAAASQPQPTLSSVSTRPVLALAAATERAVSANPVPLAHPAATASALAPVATPAQPASTPTEADENLPVAKPHSRLVTTQAPPTFTVLIRATQTSWVSIIADGAPVAKETLIAPAHTAVRATHEIIVQAANSAGISFLFNNKEIPPSGGPGEMRTYTFDSTGMRGSATLPTSNASR
ncbi:MAG: RodZ domain-containing protein [Candidatus Sulfotelmatobacter sp.]